MQQQNKNHIAPCYLHYEPQMIQHFAFLPSGIGAPGLIKSFRLSHMHIQSLSGIGHKAS